MRRGGLLAGCATQRLLWAGPAQGIRLRPPLPFPQTVPALDPALLLDLAEAQQQQEQYRGSNNGGIGGLWQLRHQSFRKLAERCAFGGGKRGLPASTTSRLLRRPPLDVAAGGAGFPSSLAGRLRWTL